MTLRISPLLLAVPLLALVGCFGSDGAEDPESQPASEIALAPSDSVVVEEVPSTSKFALSMAPEPEPTPEEAAPAPASKSVREVDDGKGLDAGQIRGPIKRNSAQVKACYERELKKNPGLAGKIALAFTIGADGTVRAAKATRNSTGSKPLAHCVASRVRGWVFPPAEGATEVEYPFVFEPRNF
jgi:TonB family protein